MYDNEEAGVTTLRLDKIDDIQEVDLSEFINLEPEMVPKEET
jgi:hypothetical protein